MSRKSSVYRAATIVPAFFIPSGGMAEAAHYRANIAGIVGRSGYLPCFLARIDACKVAP